MSHPDQEPDWDPPPAKPPAQKLLLRGVAMIIGAVLLLGAFAGFFLVVACSNLVSGSSSYAMPNAKAYLMLQASLSASVLGLLLVEYGAVAVQSRWRLLLGISSAVLLIISIPWT